MPSQSSSSTPTLPGEKPNETLHSKFVANPDTGTGDSDSDVLLVDWDGPDDPLNPLNWSYRKKWITTVIVSLFTFVTPVSSSMVAPATPQIGREFGITSTSIQALVTSVFVLGFAFGPLVLGPMSELYGRAITLQLSNLFFLAWNIGCSFSQNKSQLIAFRLLAGLGGSGPLAIGGGLLGDIWSAEERGKAIAIYSLTPLLGPVVGPMCGGWIAERSTWRWVFWSTSITDVAVQIVGLFYLRETYAPYILERKAKKLMASMDLENGPIKRVQTIYDRRGSRHWKHVFATALTRPFALFFREPIIQLLGLYMALLYGVFYLFLTTIPGIFTTTYKMPIGIAGLHYVALGIGMMLASQINAIYMDKSYVWLKTHRGHGVGEPEFRLPCMIPGTILLPAGLFLAGWAAQHQLHWIATDIGIALVGAGLILGFQVIQTYVVDAFTLYAASALAAVSFLRAAAGFGFPLFAPAMYRKLGYGLGDTVLACVAIALGCPGPFLFWFYGKKIRMMSRYTGQVTEQSPHSHFEHQNHEKGTGPKE